MNCSSQVVSLADVIPIVARQYMGRILSHWDVRPKRRYREAGGVLKTCSVLGRMGGQRSVSANVRRSYSNHQFSVQLVIAERYKREVRTAAGL